MSTKKDSSFAIGKAFPLMMQVLIELGDVCQKQKDLMAAEVHLEDALTRLTKANTPGQKLQLIKALIGLG